MVTNSQSQSGLEFKLHPLVLVNLSDHHTRTRYNSPSQQPQMVMGCLLGAQSGRSVDISNSFEAKYALGPGGSVEVDYGFLVQKQEQYKKVFPSLEIVGWYATGEGIVPAHRAVHRGMSQYNESPVFLLMDATVDAARKDLPVALFETEVHVIEGRAEDVFVRAQYTVDTSEAERIAVDQAARLTAAEQGGPAAGVSGHMQGLRTAVQMMQQQLMRVLAYVDRVISQEDRPDHAVLRQIASLSRALPVAGGEKLAEGLEVEYTDSQLVAYLSVLTRGVAALQEFSEKASVPGESRAAAVRGGGRSGQGAGALGLFP